MCVYVCMYICMYVYIYIYMNVYIYIKNHCKTCNNHNRYVSGTRKEINF